MISQIYSFYELCILKYFNIYFYFNKIFNGIVVTMTTFIGRS